MNKEMYAPTAGNAYPSAKICAIATNHIHHWMPNTSAKSWLNPSLTCLKKSKLLSKLWRTMNNLRMAAYPNELNALVYICSTKGNALRTHLLLDLGFGFSNFLMWISGNIFEKKRYRHNNNDTAAWVEGKKRNKETKCREMRGTFFVSFASNTIDHRPTTNHRHSPGFSAHCSHSFHTLTFICAKAMTTQP